MHILHSTDIRFWHRYSVAAIRLWSPSRGVCCGVALATSRLEKSVTSMVVGRGDEVEVPLRLRGH